MIAALEATISTPRMATYLLEAGHNEARALELYRWNTKLGESFHLPIQSVEVALRNRINSVMITHFDEEWWQSEAFRIIAKPKQRNQIGEVQRRIIRREAQMVTGQIVAGLSFGFWVSMLDARFNPTVWSRSLTVAFPHLPDGTSRQQTQNLIRSIAEFRNRIWHHEPIFKDSTTARYSDCMKALAWLCADKKAWVKPQCQVMDVVRARP